MNQCYTCKYRGTIPGDCHSQCKLGISALFNGGNEMPNVEGDEHGIKSGWFMWPFNFDPVWLKSCDSYAGDIQVKDSGNE
jgi:hypothetical protein